MFKKKTQTKNLESNKNLSSNPWNYPKKQKKDTNQPTPNPPDLTTLQGFPGDPSTTQWTKHQADRHLRNPKDFQVRFKEWKSLTNGPQKMPRTYRAPDLPIIETPSLPCRHMSPMGLRAAMCVDRFTMFIWSNLEIENMCAGFCFEVGPG